MMNPLQRLLLLSIVGFLMQASACQSNDDGVGFDKIADKGTSSTTNNPSQPQQNNDQPPAIDPAKEERLVSQRAQVEQEALKSVGKSCVKDLDCTLYLRCIQDACAVPPAVDGADTSEAPVVVVTTASGEAQFAMELALDIPQRSRGLMFRPRMSDEWSMLFVYDREQSDLSFWMKNTLIPLDMLFINDAGEVVGVVENAEPLTLTSRGIPGTRSRYVLEINAGLAKRFGIAAGDKVQFVRLADEHLPRR